MFKKNSILLYPLLILVSLPNAESDLFTCKKKISVNDFSEKYSNVNKYSTIFDRANKNKLIKEQYYIVSDTEYTGPCNLCKFIVDIIKRELLVSNQTIIEIEKIIKDICSHLSNKSKQKECFEIVNDIDLIKNLILDGIDPKDICVKIDFCKKS